MQLIHHYRLEKKLCENELVQVYRAREKNGEKFFTLSLVNQGYEINPKILMRMISEGDQDRLTHPHIAKIIDFGESDNQQYFVSDYIGSKTLSSFLGKPVSPAFALDVISQLASGLHFLALHGYIHGNIHPDNIFFDSYGNAILSALELVVKPETAGERDEGGEGTKRTESWSEASEEARRVKKENTDSRYYSPEFIEHNVVDDISDLYGLGVLLFEMLTGEYFDDRKYVENTEAQNINELIPYLPEDNFGFQPVINKLLAKNPKQRYQNGLQLVDALDEYDSRLVGIDEANFPMDFDDEDFQTASFEDHSFEDTSVEGSALEASVLEGSALETTALEAAAPVEATAKESIEASIEASVQVEAGGISETADFIVSPSAETTPVVKNKDKSVSTSSVIQSEIPESSETVEKDLADKQLLIPNLDVNSAFHMIGGKGGLFKFGPIKIPYFIFKFDENKRFVGAGSVFVLLMVGLLLLIPANEKETNTVVASADSPAVTDVTATEKLSTINGRGSSVVKISVAVSVEEVALYPVNNTAGVDSPTSRFFENESAPDFLERAVMGSKALDQIQEPTLLTKLIGGNLPPLITGNDVESARLVAIDLSEKVDMLLLRAQDYVKKLKFTSPKDNNAYEVYLSVLEMDPNNNSAKEGISSIAETYAQLAKRQIGEHRYEKAMRYIHKGLSIEEGNEWLISLQIEVSQWLNITARHENSRPRVKTLAFDSDFE